MMRRFIRELPREWWVAGTLAVLLIALAVVEPRCFQRRQLLSIATEPVPLLVTASGMALVIISRQIDISVGSQFALCSILLGTLTQAHWPIVLAAVVAIFAGACFGAVNGLLVAGLGLPSIVVTLATMVIGREGLRWWREGEFVRDLPADFQWLGFSQADGQNLILLLATILFLSLAAATRYLSAGRFLYAVGSDFEAARLAGLRPRRVI